MEITVEKNEILGQYDDGCREISIKISVADNISPRRQRDAVIYEVLGSLLGYILSHGQLLEITGQLGHALDQLNSKNGASAQ